MISPFISCFKNHNQKHSRQLISLITIVHILLSLRFFVDCKSSLIIMQLPNLPGYSYNNPRKSDFRKKQYFNVSSGMMATRPPEPEELERSIYENSQNLTMTAPPTQPVETFPDYVPAHVAYEHLVLRFYGYFREAITESPEENFRIRYVGIHVYLEDDTIMISERRMRNSGIDQGTLLKRMKVTNPKSPGASYSCLDFQVGINIEIFGIVYRIYSCDKFTEEYFQTIEKDIGTFEEPPDDLYSVKRQLTERPIRVAHLNTDKANLKKFLEFDGKVLRFYTIWDDRKSLFGERRKFTLQYFLVDGTIEIRQVMVQNSGRDQVSQFLRKTILKKPGTDEPYTDRDLYINQIVDAFGREFLIYDADKFTKQFLDSKYGKHDWTPLEVDTKYYQKSSEQAFPPYNGWGDEEDSLGYCISLHPKPPRKNTQKLIEKDGQLLRFEAKFSEASSTESLRLFVIAYYLADDTLSVFEKYRRNSGFSEGKFIQRGKWKNSGANNRLFAPQDFVIDEVVTINSYKFLITGADEYALRYMEAHSDDYPQSDLFAILTSIRAEIKKNSDLIKKQFEARDPELNGYIKASEAKSIIMQLLGVKSHQALTVVRRWEEEFGFDYFGFLSALA